MKKSEFIGKSRKFSGKIGQTKFLCIFFFEPHRKTIFRRKIGRKFRNFCPWAGLWSLMTVVKKIERGKKWLGVKCFIIIISSSFDLSDPQ